HDRLADCTLVVPLDADGEPPSTMIYRGHAGTLEELWTSVSAIQRKAILRLCRLRFAGSGAAGLVRDKSDWNTTSSHEYMIRSIQWYPFDHFDSDLVAVVYHIDGKPFAVGHPENDE